MTRLIEFILKHNFFYSLWNKIAADYHTVLVNEYIKPTPGMRILDICCGPAYILPLLGKNVHYIGIDFNENYIRYAKNKYTEEGYTLANFILCDASKYEVPQDEKFDRIIMCGGMHHLSNEELIPILNNAKHLLKESGRFCSLDGVYTENQSYIRKFLLNMDRGKYVRNISNYADLVKSAIPEAKYEIRSDLIITEAIIFY